MAIEQVKIHEIAKQAVSKSIGVPEFQREFVWEPDQVKRLADSLYRDYPIGSFLLWESSEYQEAKTAQGTQASLWIVDGQQRITALCLLLGMKPYWWPDAESWNKALARYNVMVNLLPEQDDNQLEFAFPNPIRRQDPRWVEIRRILGMEKVEGLTWLTQEIAKQLNDSDGTVFGKIHARLHRLWQIREAEIPIIKIHHEVEDVAEIFARLNQAGTRVKEADVFLALASVQNPGWIRQDYLPFCNDLEERGWDLDAGVFIRTTTGIGCARAHLKEAPKDFWTPNNFLKAWKTTKAVISEVLKRLAEFGITSSDLLPSTNSLIPLSVLHHRWGDHQGYAFSKALWWFLLANRDGRYSGSTITSLNEDVRAIMEAPDFEGALESLCKRLQVPDRIEAEEFLNRYDRAGNRFLRLLLYLVLFQHKAVDWVDQTRLGYDNTGTPITAGFQPEWHHIYPYHLLKKADIPLDDIHSLANITVLNSRTNANKISGKEPWHYIQQYRIPTKVLLAHLIPEPYANAVENRELLKNQWDIKQYTDFLHKRAHLLAQESNAFFYRLRG